MIGHQRQAITMADLAEENAQGDDVKEVAERIGDGPPLEEMTSLYSEWRRTRRRRPRRRRGSGQRPSGFLNETEMEILESTSGSRFDRLFLEEMVDHHPGAVAGGARRDRPG